MTTLTPIQRALEILDQPPLRQKPQFLKAQESWPDAYHGFDDRTLLALRSAIAAQRPLLIRGEPGIGKSQIARAAAAALEAPFLSFVVNSTCECGDLLFSADPVARLAQAQVLGAGGEKPEDWKDLLAESRFIRPRPLWWAFNWAQAREQAAKYHVLEKEPPRPADWTPARGCVVLIDEIDKAESDLPNGLLESLGNSGFQVPQASVSVSLNPEQGPPLIVITTNEERELPAAFVRRCLVLQLPFPPEGMTPEVFLAERGRAHFGPMHFAPEVLEVVAEQLLKDRACTPEGQPKPGAAEYLDLLKALHQLAPDNPSRQKDLLKRIGEFVLRKHVVDPVR